PRFQGVEPGEWHTGDFDSLWFARDSVSSLTPAALDAQGRIPPLHRPSDTLENVDPEVVGQAVDFAEATVRRLAASPVDR
ncbi:MAG: peptidase M28, partial [bacterium]|nr:peptidase M28 [bacterium]